MSEIVFGANEVPRKGQKQSNVGDQNEMSKQCRKRVGDPTEMSTKSNECHKNVGDPNEILKNVSEMSANHMKFQKVSQTNQENVGVQMRC